jgi:hypothetical protein
MNWKQKTEAAKGEPSSMVLVIEFHNISIMSFDDFKFAHQKINVNIKSRNVPETRLAYSVMNLTNCKLKIMRNCDESQDILFSAQT